MVAAELPDLRLDERVWILKKFATMGRTLRDLYVMGRLLDGTRAAYGWRRTDQVKYEGWQA